MIDFRRALEVLVKARVDFVVVGGAAATVHGSARLTQDLDIVYDRSPENIDRLVNALEPHRPYLRGAPPGLPFIFDSATVRSGLNFTLTTDLGDLDLLGEVVGGGTYGALVAHSAAIEVFGVRCLCVGLPKLIELKRAAGRTKDLEAIAELEVLRQERGE